MAACVVVVLTHSTCDYHQHQQVTDIIPHSATHHQHGLHLGDRAFMCVCVCVCVCVHVCVCVPTMGQTVSEMLASHCILIYTKNSTIHINIYCSNIPQ